jgi:aspartyl-tRNA(Asn)/glutamyl-tRNA(Gln) amidotransferase subunit C
MKLTQAEVAHVARLARLRIEPEELERMRTQLSNILESIAALQEVNISAVPPTAQITELTTVLRDDAVTERLSREEAVANAPAQRDGLFKVRAVFDE